MGDIKELIRQRSLELGACRCGCAVAEPVDHLAQEQYSRWLAAGRHAGMEYCERNCEVRNDPRLLLDGAKTVICCAFAYPCGGNGKIASYALGLDYHYVIKERLRQLGAFITEQWGGEVRALVDTAPMAERYWAVRSGVGFIGMNNMLIVPAVGSYVFLGELLWTGTLSPDEPCRERCEGCKACVSVCPNGALCDGNVDANKCISYLTIEHRGELPPGVSLGGSIYGCDRCQRVCPHNRGNEKVTVLQEFMPREEIIGLSAEDFVTMTPSHYKKLVAHSAMRRAPLAQLRRNISVNSEQ